MDYTDLELVLVVFPNLIIKGVEDLELMCRMELSETDIVNDLALVCLMLRGVLFVMIYFPFQCINLAENHTYPLHRRKTEKKEQFRPFRN